MVHVHQWDKAVAVERVVQDSVRDDRLVVLRYKAGLVAKRAIDEGDPFRLQLRDVIERDDDIAVSRNGVSEVHTAERAA